MSGTQLEISDPILRLLLLRLGPIFRSQPRWWESGGFIVRLDEDWLLKD